MNISQKLIMVTCFTHLGYDCSCREYITSGKMEPYNHKMSIFIIFSSGMDQLNSLNI